ncbi:precorrin-6y C5,15-methyltransferase (decarboxylating) subunit CbiE [Arhodomonas sp. AD133]|uniref:precorrin-6y C5,15-methyltransferase (decarboxylating) subunit CbiE n=1 Tax=Arhodomonas sp. AD133 TaxID=3415009 RepID=UPI003EC13361
MSDAMMATHGPVIDVVGLGIADTAPAHPAAQAALAEAEVIFGSPRQLRAVPDNGATREPYPSPFSALIRRLAAHEGKRICLLASGDPLFHGVGAWAARRLPAERLRFHSAPSSVQTACARVGLPTAECETVSLHGRPLTRLRARLHGNRLYALLGDAEATPPAIARELVAAGFPDSLMWIAERLGAAQERITTTDARTLAHDGGEFDPLQVTLVRTRGPGGVLPEFPGLPDTAFDTGAAPGRGLITKREVRLAVLSALAPRAGDVGWDIGAGCGGVAVEWARWNPRVHVYAIEREAGRLAHLYTNRDRYGVDANLTGVHGEAPAALADLPDPDAVFIGGHGGVLPELLRLARERLRPDGRLVATAVTEPARRALIDFADATGSESKLTELSVARGDRLNGELLLRPQLPVLILAWSKRDDTDGV